MRERPGPDPSRRRRRTRRLIAGVLLLLLVLVVAGRWAARRDTGPTDTAAAPLVRANAAPDAGTPDGRLLLYNARPQRGRGDFDAFVATGPHADRLRGRRLLPPRRGHRGAADVSDDGRYVLLVTARGRDRSAARAQPGKGSGNSVDVLDRTTKRVTTIVRGGCDGCPRAVIWPRFGPDPDGGGPAGPTLVHWSEQLEPPWRAPRYGRWRQHLTAIRYDADGTPSAGADRTWEHPDGKAHISETYGFLPGTDRVVFMSDNDVPGRSVFRGQLFTLPRSAFTAPGTPSTVRPRRFTAPFRDEDGRPVQANTEFAHFHPDHPGWLYTSVAFESDRGTLDLWRYRFDAAGNPTGERQRLTWFGGRPRPRGGFARRRGFPDPAFRVVGGMAPLPDGRWLGGVCTGITCERIDAHRLPAAP